MVVVGWVEIPKHGQGFNLGPPTPCSNHSDSPVFVPDPVLTSTPTERVSPIQCPGFVSKVLQVCGEGTAEYIVGLYKSIRLIMVQELKKHIKRTTSSWLTAPCLFNLRNRGPDRSLSFPYSIATRISARIGHILMSRSLAYSRHVCNTPNCADLQVFSPTSKYSPVWISCQDLGDLRSRSEGNIYVRLEGCQCSQIGD
jgi:hypothetical protein